MRPAFPRGAILFILQTQEVSLEGQFRETKLVKLAEFIKEIQGTDSHPSLKENCLGVIWKFLVVSMKPRGTLP